MSSAGGLGARLLASVGGPQTAALLVLGGIVAGALGGGAITGGVFSGPTAASGNELAVYPCPNVGPPLTTIKRGQKMLVTGRTEDGTWVRIHFPEPGRTEAWVQAQPLTVSAALSSVPVATCAPEFAAAAASVQPGESLTAIESNSPSPAATPVSTAKPTPSPSPSATTSPVGPPSVTALTASTSKISYDQGSYCPTAVKRVTFTVKGADDAGLVGVTLFWRAPWAAAYAQAAMSLHTGTATNGTWQVSLDTTANGITKAGTLAYYVVATNTAGATSRRPASGASSITVAICANTGPSITSVASSSGSSLVWDPLGVGTCQTATDITATVSDPDGVKSVTLFYSRPGSAAWSSKPMDNQTVAGKWYANLDTLGDKISIPAPPAGTLSWYIKAIDGKNVASQAKTASITIQRCDSPAGFDGVFPTSQAYSCKAATIQISTYANDTDQPEAGLNVVFYWTLSNPRVRTVTPISGQVGADIAKGNEYWGTTASFTGQTFYAGLLTVYAVTTDKYGGTTQSQVSTYPMKCQ